MCKNLTIHIVFYQNTNDSADVQDISHGNEEIVMASYGTKMVWSALAKLKGLLNQGN